MTDDTFMRTLIQMRYRWARRRAVERALRRVTSRRQAMRIARLIP